MPSPNSTPATQRPDLAASLEEFDVVNDRNGFIGSKVMPKLDVMKQAGTFGRVPVEALLQNRETKRSPGSGYARGDFEWDTDSYATVEHGAEEPVDDREAEMYAEYFDAELLATVRARDVVLRNREKRIANAIFNATTFTSQKTTIVDEWDDYVNAIPVNDIEAAVKAVWNQCGLWANALIINRHVFRNLRLCKQVQDLLKYNGIVDVRPGAINEAILATLFDLDYIIVAGGTQNLANEAKAASFGKIWSDEYAMVARICTTQDIREPGLARSLFWDGDGGGNEEGTVETYRDETKRSNIVRVRQETMEKLMYVECGRLLDNVTT